MAEYILIVDNGPKAAGGDTFNFVGPFETGTAVEWAQRKHAAGRIPSSWHRVRLDDATAAPRILPPNTETPYSHVPDAIPPAPGGRVRRRQFGARTRPVCHLSGKVAPYS